MQERYRFGVEVDGMANDLDSGVAHDVVNRLLTALGVDQMPAAQAEDRVIGEDLVEVGVGVAGWFLALYLASATASAVPWSFQTMSGRRITPPASSQ